MKRYKTLKRLKKKEIRKEKIKRKPPFTRRKSRYANEVPIGTDIAVKDAPESSLDLSEPANSVVIVVVCFFLHFHGVTLGLMESYQVCLALIEFY